jgi:hypothetical protein
MEIENQPNLQRKRFYSFRALQSIVLVLLLGCSPAKKNNAHFAMHHSDTSVHKEMSSGASNRFHKLKKLFVIGDFAGDGVRDTLVQHAFSKIHRTEIDSAPDPVYNEWDTVVRWFDKEQADVYAAFNKPNRDTLHLGSGQGLYCLINIGDNNADGKDEVALVVDQLDFSRVNRCGIYTLCKRRWAELNSFCINENAFDYVSDTVPTFCAIKGYLEKRKGKWYYLDYERAVADTVQEEMNVLKVKRCENLH